VERALAGGAVDTARIWPRLDTISCWLDGASAGFGAELRATFPSAHFQAKGLLSTEGAVSFPYGDGDGALLALASTFCEFVDEQGMARPGWQVDTGGRYRVVISNRSGLYRYDTGDVVDVVGFAGRTPRLRFVGRGSLASDLCGEKLTDAFVSACLARLPLKPGQCAFIAPLREPKPHYLLFLEPAAESDPAALRAELDGCLRENPQYAYAQAIGQLGGVEVQTVAGLFQRYQALAVAGGRSIAGLKAPALVTNLGEGWREALGGRSAAPEARAGRPDREAG
jgi:hypothetical protein